MCSVSALVIGAPGKASGYCSQSERLLFGRHTRNLRCFFRRFVGRNRKGRSREAAGRRNYPEAVPNGERRNGNNAPKESSSVAARTEPQKRERQTARSHITTALGVQNEGAIRRVNRMRQSKDMVTARVEVSGLVKPRRWG